MHTGGPYTHVHGKTTRRLRQPPKPPLWSGSNATGIPQAVKMRIAHLAHASVCDLKFPFYKVVVRILQIVMTLHSMRRDRRLNHLHDARVQGLDGLRMTFDWIANRCKCIDFHINSRALVNSIFYMCPIFSYAIVYLNWVRPYTCLVIILF